MRSRFHVLAAVVLAATISVPPTAHAGLLERALARGAARSVGKSLRTAPTRTLRQIDLWRHGRTPVHRLTKPRTVFRYTTRPRARTEISKGIPPGRHMTSHAGPGRPLRAERAKQRFGLPQRPDARETVRLPKGQPVQFNRALGGKPGTGELVSPKRVPPKAIEKVVPLR